MLRAISISHESASLTSREYYYLNTSAKDYLTTAIKGSFRDVKGLVLLSTCNRTEIYFESDTTLASDVACFFVQELNPGAVWLKEKEKFKCFDNSLDATHHLLYVANGLKSAVVGDGQILSQIKQAYRLALDHGLQGSVLERAFQAVFRSHKKISNTSSFRHGSRSTAYRALKLIQKNMGRLSVRDKKLLVIGAGEIASDVLKYLVKFPFHEVYIANRTSSKAVKLAKYYGMKIYEWEKVEAAEYSGFDAIITAVSNRKGLINKDCQTLTESVVITDLALPANVDDGLREKPGLSLYNIDEITEGIEQSEYIHSGVIALINKAIYSELQLFEQWVKSAGVRAFLRHYKKRVIRLVDQTIDSIPELDPDQKEVNHWINQMVRKAVHRYLFIPGTTIRPSVNNFLSEFQQGFPDTKLLNYEKDWNYNR